MSGKVEYFKFPALNNSKNSNLIFAIELDTLRFQENEDLLRFLEFGCASGSDLLNYYHKSIQEYNKNKEKRKQIKYSELCDASFLRLSRFNMRKIIEAPYNRYELEDYSISFTKFSLMTKKVSYYERFGYISPNINFIICSDFFCPIETNSGSSGGHLYANKLLYSKAIFNEIEPKTYLNKILEHRNKFFVRKVNISGLFQVNLGKNKRGEEIEVKSGIKHKRNLVIQKMLVLFKQSNSEIVKTINKYEIGVIREDLEFLKDLLEQKIISNEANNGSDLNDLIFTEYNLIYFRDYYQKLELLIIQYPKLTIKFLFELCEKIINLCPYFNNFSELNNHISRNIFTLFNQIDSFENLSTSENLFKEISIILKAIPPPRKKLSKDLSNLKKIVIYELESVLNSNIPIPLAKDFTEFNEDTLINILNQIDNLSEDFTPTTYDEDAHKITSMSHCFNDFKIELHKPPKNTNYLNLYTYYYGLLIQSNNGEDLIVDGATIADIFNFFWMSLNYVVNNIKKYPLKLFKDYGKFLHDLFFVPNPKTGINLLKVYSISSFNTFSKPIIHNLKYLYDTKKTTNVKYFDDSNLVLCKGGYYNLSKDNVSLIPEKDFKINSVKEIGGVKFTTTKVESEGYVGNEGGEAFLRLQHPREIFPDSCLKSELVFIDGQGMEAFFNDEEQTKIEAYSDIQLINEKAQKAQETTYKGNLDIYTRNLKNIISVTLTSIHILIRDFVGGNQGGGGGREMNGGGGIQNWKVPNPTAFLGSPTNMLMSVVKQVFEGTKTTISASSVIIGEIKTKIQELVYNPFNSVEKDFLNELPQNFDGMEDPIELEIILKVLKDLQKKIQNINKPNSLHRYYSDDYVKRRMREKTELVVSLHNLKVRLSYYDSIADGIKDNTNLSTQFGSTIATHVESEFSVFSREFNRSEIIQNFLERHPKEF